MVVFGNAPERITRLYHINDCACRADLFFSIFFQRDIRYSFSRFFPLDVCFHCQRGAKFALPFGKYLEIQILQAQFNFGCIALLYAL